MTDNFSNNPRRQRIFSAEFPPELNENNKRSSLIENQITEVLQFSEDDFSARLKITDYKSENYLKGETLICLLNLARAENLVYVADLISNKLAGICDKLVRDFLQKKGFGENFIEEAIGELVFEMFTQILERKEKSYDFWEVNFYVSLQRLTKNYLRKHEAKASLTNNFAELSSVENEDEFDFESSLPKFETLTVERKLEIKQILGKMPDEHRRIFHLYYIEDWAQAQIAEVFGFTARTVRNRLKDIEDFLEKFRNSQGGEK